MGKRGPKPKYSPEERILANRAKVKRYKAKHPGISTAESKAYRLAHPTYHRNRQRLERLGITPEIIIMAEKEQKGLCALCHRPFGNQTPCADHDHFTNVFRGLIHRKCNSGLGFFNDSLDLLKLAVEYLEKTNASK
jgi:hypothetical protein